MDAWQSVDANKMARMIWAMMVTGERYRDQFS
jgi:hypothetical protein